ncbi:4Fe-4S dicluster domain-containing protein [Thermosyntropha lipolytica DSM 11003]|uniref:4Fe-4S dicluster domain-containing protein n=1 Tax=Thermosyntropha lipolytica DSM 11003 TaxID=1123382 RepID=A0A1M5QB86_9FIRM|nr:4Fe-4S dicluster domain-containing protein [Thermosyntropha lipolytica]SHH11424.1 4Fe-4S dicluster domain-containing protein [Thermosyntropha lipolytica DSM 11003]
MKEITAKIQETAARLLTEGRVDIFIGWQKGEFGYNTKPFFAHSPEEADKLVFDEYSIHNLSNALLKFRDGHQKIGIVVKGCDSRGIVRLLEDNQFKRERLYIVGVCCPGMKDPLKKMYQDSGFAVQVNGDAELADKCRYCIQPNPVIYDELIGEKREPRLPEDRFKEVKELETKSYDERYQFFEQVLSTCIRCYACRQACVACNCRTCIFDETRPQWVGRETSISDNMMYHLVRAFHMAGRCVECGECERVCPVGIPLMLINRKLIKDVGEFFGPYEAGMEYKEGAKPPLSVYREDDPDDFI